MFQAWFVYRQLFEELLIHIKTEMFQVCFVYRQLFEELLIHIKTEMFQVCFVYRQLFEELLIHIKTDVSSSFVLFQTGVTLRACRLGLTAKCNLCRRCSSRSNSVVPLTPRKSEVCHYLL